MRRCFDVNPETGLIFHKEKPLYLFKDLRAQKVTNTLTVGRPAFNSKTNSGYLYGQFAKNKIAAHHIVWFYVHGYWAEELDHINRDKCDNRIVNLREVDRTYNNYNKIEQRNNTSGKRGVSKVPGCQTWRAYGNFKKKQYHLGCYECLEDAIKAREDWEESMGF